MGPIDWERNSAHERVSVIARLRALGVDLSEELLHAAQVAESVQSWISSNRERGHQRGAVLRYFTLAWHSRFRSPRNAVVPAAKRYIVVSSSGCR